jgi:hypothetical protein
MIQCLPYWQQIIVLQNKNLINKDPMTSLAAAAYSVSKNEKAKF